MINLTYTSTKEENKKTRPWKAISVFLGWASVKLEFSGIKLEARSNAFYP